MLGQGMDGTLTFADDQNWFVVSEPSRGVFAIREPLQVDDVRSYLIAGSEKAILVDTGTGVGDIRKIVEQLTDLPVGVVNSHSHWDHIGGNWRFDDIAIHPLEASWLNAPELSGQLKEA